MSNPIALELMPSHVVETFRHSMSDAQIAGFFARFVDHAHQTCQQLSECLAKGDRDELGRKAHALIGSSAMLELHEISEISRALELGKSTASRAELSDLIQSLSEAVGELSDAIAD